MRGSLSKARVLYAPVMEIGSEDRLLHACRILYHLAFSVFFCTSAPGKRKLLLPYNKTVLYVLF